MARTEICPQCGLVHDGAGIDKMCLQAARQAMQKLLNLVGQPAVCRGCKSSIFFVRHLAGALTPYDASGLNHFVSCPSAGQFTREAARHGPLAQ